eukprot:scaffold629809_cov51-Attheya_sp.AAC.1
MNLFLRELAGAGDWASIRWKLIGDDVIGLTRRHHLKRSSPGCTGGKKGETSICNHKTTLLSTISSHPLSSSLRYRYSPS